MNKRLFGLVKRFVRYKNFKEFIIVILCLFAIALLANPKAFNVDSYSLDELLDKVVVGKVVKVIDGDTIVVLDDEKRQHKIRLHGIDAPEKKQAYGQASRVFLASLIADKSVKVVITSKDKYQRNIGKVFLGDLDVNKEMVANGYAHAYVEYSKDYIAQESEAKKAQLGLWHDKDVIKPSDFRKKN